MKENIILIIFAGFMFWSLFMRDPKLEREIESLKKQLKELNKKLLSGKFFVRLESVDEDKKNLLITVISIIMGSDKEKAKSMVDAVRLGSMSIIVDKVSEERANQVKQAIENHGGTATIVENK